MFPRNSPRRYRAPLTSSGRAFPRVAGDGGGANRQKSLGSSKARRASTGVCVSLTLLADRRRNPESSTAPPGNTVRGRPCNEQHCIRAANPRAHLLSRRAAAVLGRTLKKDRATPSAGHDCDLKKKLFVIPACIRATELFTAGPIILR